MRFTIRIISGCAGAWALHALISAVLGVSICFALALASAQAATDTASTVERKLTLPDGVPMPVSIISITPNSALVADYWQITEIDLN